MTLLPDGTVLVSGGMTTSDGTDLTKAVLPAEIWNPDTETWTTVASLQNGREYHSTALLLPDGRVLMSGGGRLGGRAANQNNAEIYSPPYLFKGPRPTITCVARRRRLRHELRRVDAERRPDREGVADPLAVGHARNRHEPAVPVPQLHAGERQGHRHRAGERQPRAAGRLSALPRRHERRPVRRVVHPPVDHGRHRAADGTDGLSAVGTSGQVALTWGASSDPSGIARYNVHRSTTAGFTPSTANRVAQPTGTSYTDVGVVAGTYYYKVTAEDNANNTSPASNEATAVVPSGPLPGLVGAWGFDEGSGTTTADKSGSGNNGTLSNATWSTLGKFGNALSFNGTNSFVSVADSNSLDVTTGVTIEGWVRPSVGAGWQTLLVKERPGNIVYGFYSSTDRNTPETQVTASSTQSLYGPTAIPPGVWTHVAGTYDGTTHRLFVNGNPGGATRPHRCDRDFDGRRLKIGGNAIWSEWFNGLIDEVRLYSRALSPAEIQTDMNMAITTADAVPPGAPGTLNATAGLGQISLAWGRGDGQPRRCEVQRAPLDDNAVHAERRQPDRPADRHDLHRPWAHAGNDLLLPGDRGGRRGQRRPGRQRGRRLAAGRHDAPDRTVGALGVRNLRPGRVDVDRSTDAGGIARYNVHRSTTAGFTPSTANRIAQPTGTSYNDGGVTGGTTYYYRVTAEDPAGNVSTPSNEASATVPIGPPPGLVAAYGFDAGSGTSAADQSGTGNTGTLTNATWAGAGAGRYGNALSFNGTNALVTVADSNSLDLTTGMTVEAWVRPTTVGGFNTVIVKERPGDLVYGLYSSSDSNRPQSQVTVGSVRDPRRNRRDPGRRLDASGRDVRRHDPAALRQRHTGRHARVSGQHPHVDLAGEDRRQLDLERVVQRVDRRGADLQPRPVAPPRSRPT